MKLIDYFFKIDDGSTLRYAEAVKTNNANITAFIGFSNILLK